MSLRPPEPVLVVDLFPAERAALLVLLRGMDPDDWMRPARVGEWTVKDISAHLVADDLGRVSRQRDGFTEPRDPAAGSLAAFIDRRNAEWVVAMRRLSPAILVSLLAFGGRETQTMFEEADLFALDGAVSWAGPEPAPVWLDLARELTERWHHQQQIRDALGLPSLDDPRLLRPVLATFAFALPRALRDSDAATGTVVEITVEGESGGVWSVERETAGWVLRLGSVADPVASVRMGEDTAWRMYVRALPADDVEQRSRLDGDRDLAETLLAAFALVS